METKNTEGTEVEEAGVVKQAGSVAGSMSQVLEWIESAPVFLKAERVQKSGEVQRPPKVANAGTIEDARSFIEWVRAVLDWIEKAPAFLLELFGLRNNDPNDQ